MLELKKEQEVMQVIKVLLMTFEWMNFIHSKLNIAVMKS